MRGIAALLIPVCHLQQRWHGDTIVGYLAVDLFFVLSGFVIALNYTGRFANGLTVSRYMELRLIRLFPLYAIGLALGIAKLAMGFVVHIAPAATVGSLPCAIAFGAVMLPDPCSPELFPLNGPSWSLFLEMVINLVFGLLLWRGSLTLLALLIAGSAIALSFLVGPPDYFNIGWGWHNLVGGLLRTTLSFCAGIVLFRIMPSGWRIPSYLSILPIVGMVAVVGVSAPAAYRVSFEIASVVLFLPGLVFLGCLFEVPNKVVGRAFNFLGDLAYPIYSIHWPLIAAMLLVSARLHLPNWLSITIFLAILIPLAFIAVQVDEFVRKRISTALKVRRTAPALIA